MRARFLANASMSTAPVFTGAGAASSFMVTPPSKFRGRKSSERKPVNLLPAQSLRSLLWTYYRATRVPDQYIEFTPISRLLPHLRRGVCGAQGSKGSERWDGWNGAVSHGGV